MTLDSAPQAGDGSHASRAAPVPDRSCEPARNGYPSDLTDRQWSRIAALLPPLESSGRPLSHDLREIVNALSYRWRSGCSWRMLPHDLPPWGTVYRWERRRMQSGCLARVRDLTRYADHLAARHHGESSTERTSWKTGDP